MNCLVRVRLVASKFSSVSYPVLRQLSNKPDLKATGTMTSRFAAVPMGPPVEIFAITKACVDDPYEHKVNLGIGAYRTNEGKPWVLPVVRAAEKAIANDESMNKEYLAVLGLESFTNNATAMLLGSDNPAIKEKRAFGIQALSGTGALTIGASFLSNVLGYKTYYCSGPTWANHRLIFNNVGFTESRTYRYWSQSNRGLDIDGFLTDLNSAPPNSVIILHTAAHNPTGCDPTQEQWKEIADVMQERQLFPFFDSAYQGFASGDLEKDAWSIRYFVRRGFELFCSQSFAKNFGLYCERVGNVTVVLKKQDEVAAVKSQFTLLVRGMYSNPPAHGAHIVNYVLSNPQLYEEWKGCIKTMSSRIIEMRRLLRDALEKLKTPGDWSHITNQIGMFSYTGLDEQQSVAMVERHHVYMLRSGRISMCGITPGNVEYVAKAMNEVIVSSPNHKM